MNNWKSIWNNRKVEASGSILGRLLTADGYDTAFGKTDEKNFLSNIPIITKQLSLEKNESLFEVGCGAGAVLYPFYKEGYEVAGLDYSKPLIETAKSVMPGMDFDISDADLLDEKIRFDIVFSFGVFIYFKDYEYAETVLRKMIGKAKKRVGIFDISDFELKARAEKLRRDEMGDEEYEKRYKGLGHLYYPRSFFQRIAQELNCNINIFPQTMGEYKNSFYRYNVIFDVQ